MLDLLEAVLVFLPAGVANSAPPVLTRFFGPGRPIDAGRSWRGRPILGKHKTWLGLIGGTLAGVTTFAVQRRFDHLPIPLIAGVAMSFGALAGDLAKSFMKRRFAIAPGRSWFPFDQLDYIAGGLLMTAPFLRFTPGHTAALVAVYFVLHLMVSAIGFALGVKDSLL